MVEGGHHPRNRPPTLGTTSVDFYHYPVTVWAYSTPQPNTEVPAPTGGIFPSRNVGYLKQHIIKMSSWWYDWWKVCTHSRQVLVPKRWQATKWPNSISAHCHFQVDYWKKSHQKDRVDKQACYALYDLRVTKFLDAYTVYCKLKLKTIELHNLMKIVCTTNNTCEINKIQYRTHTNISNNCTDKLYHFAQHQLSINKVVA